ncbi:hypothetical protein ASE82_13400 [Sphingomonas sp. Leaf230]|nr:hypothetical protein ASE82_13400 [Sphingomonas sp. Leaf230]
MPKRGGTFADQAKVNFELMSVRIEEVGRGAFALVLLPNYGLGCHTLAQRDVIDVRHAKCDVAIIQMG